MFLYKNTKKWFVHPMVSQKMISLKKGKKLTINILEIEDSSDYLGLRPNTPTEADCQLHRLEQAARGIGLCKK